MLNFNLPYFSKNPKEFWSRWHISLSTWLRDYLYIPLGGNQKGAFRTYINLMTTMVLGGLWHGAAWPFVLWGTYQGALLCIHRKMQSFLERIVPKIPWRAKVWYLICTVCFFHLICIGWLFFRAESVESIVLILNTIFTNFWGSQPGWATFDGLLVLLSCGAFLFFVQIAQYFTNDLNCFFRIPFVLRSFAYFILLSGIIIFGNLGSDEFIYFQF